MGRYLRSVSLSGEGMRNNLVIMSGKKTLGIFEPDSDLEVEIEIDRANSFWLNREEAIKVVNQLTYLFEIDLNETN